MKRKYVTPQVKFLKVEATHLIAASFGGPGNGRPAQSPEHFFFDDENEEE